MDKIPFSVYDLFGYLTSGFLVMAAIDYAFHGGWLLRPDIELVYGVLWVVVAYITGHILANVSGYLLESKIVRRVLRSPEETLFSDNRPKWSRIFPGFYTSLPLETRTRVLQKAEGKAGIRQPGRGLYYHCFAIVKRNEACMTRLNTFLNLYGFCRNVCLSLVVVTILLLIGRAFDSQNSSVLSRGGLCPLISFAASIGMFYRYLKFFRHYTVEVFVTYAELE